MQDDKTLYTDADTKSYLEKIKSEQDKINVKIEWVVNEYQKLYKIWKANDNIIGLLEETLGIREPKKPKSKNHEETESNPSNKLNTDMDYDSKATVAQKAVYALEKVAEELSTNQILELLYPIDSTLVREKNRENMSKFSATLIQKLNKKEIFYRTENKEKELVWGLKTWQKPPANNK